MIVKGNKVFLRNIEEKDLQPLWELIYGDANPEWKKWDAPYFPLTYIDYQTFYHREINEIHNEELPRWMLIETIEGEMIAPSAIIGSTSLPIG